MRIEDPNSIDRLINMVPIKASYDSQFFLMARKTINGQWEGGVSRLLKGKKRQYEFDEISKIENLGDLTSTFFYIDTAGELYSVQF